MKIKTNLVSGIFFAALSLILYLLVPSQIVVSDIIPFLESAKAAPLLAIAVMFIGGVTLIFQSLVLKKEHEVEIDLAEQKYALYMFLLLMLYAGLIYATGFIIGSSVLVLILFRFFRIRNRLQLAIVIAIVVLVYFLFTTVFHISLPGFGGVLL